MNSTNMIYLVKESYNSGDSWLMQKYQKINTLYSCLVKLLFSDNLQIVLLLLSVLSNKYNWSKTCINKYKHEYVQKKNR